MNLSLTPRDLFRGPRVAARRRLARGMDRPRAIEYARNGDVSIAYSVGGRGAVDVLVIGGFAGHLGS